MLTRLLLISVLSWYGGSVRAQSLGEAAAREKERKAKLAGPARSYTDADLRAVAGKRVSQSGAASSRLTGSSSAEDTPAVATTSQDSTASTDLSRSDALKKARGADYKARLAELDHELEAALEDLATAEKRWNTAQNHPWEFPAEFDRARSQFEAARERVAGLRRQRDEIEDAARREGIPPGYLR